MKTGDDYRRDIKKHVQAYRQRMRDAGYKNITVFISADFYKELERLKAEEGLTREAAMEHIFQGYMENRDITSNDTIKKTSNMTGNEADSLIVDLRNQGEQFKAIAESLNDKGLLTTKGRKWTPDNVRMAFYKLTK